MSDERDVETRRDALSASKRALLDQWMRGGRAATPPAARMPRASTLPLSFAQQRLWLMNRMAAHADAYNIPSAIRLRPALDPELLGRALDLLVQRHESLRTSFIETKNGPAQVIGAAARAPFRVEDLRRFPRRERDEVAARLELANAQDPFDLANAPLLRAVLVWIADDEQLLLLTMHHLVIDGWSMQVFFRELNEAYVALEAGRQPEWQPVLQYADYVEWQRTWLAGEEAAAQEAWWARRLDGLAPLDLPADRPRPAVPRDRGSQRTVTLPRALSAAIESLARAERMTTFQLLLAALGSVLARLTGQDDLAIGAPTAGRSDSRWEPVVGLFLNTVVLRLDLAGNPTFRQTLARVRESTLDAYSHQELPFERVQRATGHAPLFNVMFNLLAYGEVALPQRELVAGVHAPFDLSVYAFDRGHGELSLSVVYPDDRFAHESMRRFVAQWIELLEAVTANPELTLAAVPIGVAEAPARAAVEWNARSIVERFDDVALAQPNRVAIESGSLRWTYRQLREESVRIAGIVRERCGAGEGRLGLLFGHDAAAVAAILGALRAGKCYVVLDVEDVEERLAHIAADAELEAILTEEGQFEEARALARGRCPVGVVPSAVEGSPDRAEGTGSLDCAREDNRPAYILYTSGSTGRPKGVVQTHRGVLGHIRTYVDALGIAPSDRVSVVASLSTDAAVMDVFGALLSGAALCMFDVRRGALAELPEWIEDHAITIYHSTPTVFRYLGMTGTLLPPFSRLRHVVLGGEEVVRRDFELFRDRFPRGCTFVNGFGPTESTLALQQFLDHDTPITNRVPIGRPVAGTEIALLDRTSAEITGAGVGELEVRGPFVAHGYWRDPAATAEAFREEPGRRCYRTGDLARRLADGSYEFIGRRDEQVKVNGRRVELGEIEACLTSSPDVREAFVITRPDAAGSLRLIAYVVPERGGAAPAELRRFLQRRLPAYMLPSDLIVLDALPRTASGKIDRRRLPATSASVWTREYCAPRTAHEGLLARMWQDVLGVERVGVHDNFFELGGHSLLAAQLVSRIRDAFSVEIPMRRVFESPSVELLAAAIGEAADAGAAAEIVPVPREHFRRQ